MNPSKLPRWSRAVASIAALACLKGRWMYAYSAGRTANCSSTIGMIGGAQDAFNNEFGFFSSRMNLSVSLVRVHY